MRLLFSGAFALLLHSMAWSCSCVYIPTFCETLTFWDGVIDTNYLIVHARVEDKLNDGLRVTVLSELFGHSDKVSLVIRKGNGADCLVNTDIFEEGKEYIFAFHGKNNDRYNLGDCGISWLRVEDGIAKGDITETIKSHPVSALNEILECPGLQPGIGRVRLYPNPATTLLQISLEGGVNRPLEVLVFDMAGRLVLTRENQIISPETPYRLDINTLAQGIYFIQYRIGSVLYSDRVFVAGPI